MSEEEAIDKLEEFLKPRIEAARRGEFSTRSVEQIFEDVRQEQKRGNPPTRLRLF